MANDVSDRVCDGGVEHDVTHLHSREVDSDMLPFREHGLNLRPVGEFCNEPSEKRVCREKMASRQDGAKCPDLDSI